MVIILSKSIFKSIFCEYVELGAVKHCVRTFGILFFFSQLALTRHEPLTCCFFLPKLPRVARKSALLRAWEVKILDALPPIVHAELANRTGDHRSAMSLSLLGHGVVLLQAAFTCSALLRWPRRVSGTGQQASAKVASPRDRARRRHAARHRGCDRDAQM